jgi:hypothetical protein
MLAFGDEAFEIVFGLADRVRARDADGIEAMFARRLSQRRLDAFGVQKSRSA